MENNSRPRNFGKDELRKRVDEVLFYVWDPIGVSQEPFARAEYEEYVPRILELLEKNDAGAISAYLAETEVNTMGMAPANKEKCDQVARLLLVHKEAIGEGCA